MTPKVIKFKDIKHRFPADTICIKYWEENQPGVADERDILYFETDLNIENLDLDNPEITFNIDRLDDLLTIVVEGNLNAKNIYNDETDGSTNLLIFGNLNAQNIVVGGQEIYVCGDLNTKELFWGDYNHGNLEVKGSINAHIFIDTDYGVPEFMYSNPQPHNGKISYRFSDELDEEYEKEKIQNLFVDEVVEDDEDESCGWGGVLSRYQILENLQQNQPILNPNPILPKEQEIPELFIHHQSIKKEDLTSWIANYKKIYELIQAEEENEVVVQLPTTQTRVTITKAHKKASDNRQADQSIYLMTENNDEFFVWIPPKKKLLQKMIGSTSEMDILHKNSFANKFHFQPIFGNTEKTAQLEHIWEELLTAIEKGVFYHQKFTESVRPQMIQDILQLPIVQEKYTDFWDTDKMGDWYNNYHYSFCTNKKDKKTKYALAMRISVENEFEGDQRFYMFQLMDDKNPTAVVLDYNASYEGNASILEYYNTSKKVLLTDGDKYKEALKWFEKAQKNIVAMNKKYLDENQEIDKILENYEVLENDKTAYPLFDLDTYKQESRYENLQNIFSAWIAEISKIVPKDNEYFTLKDGISDEELEQFAQINNEIAIPNELISLYKIFNVSYNFVASAFFFSINNWSYYLLPFASIRKEWEDINDLNFEDLEEIKESVASYSPKVKADNYANPRWIPFAEGKNGDYLLYDTDPSATGTYGQIIELQNESWERNVVANSLSELLENEIKQLEKKSDVFDFILGKKKDV